MDYKPPAIFGREKKTIEAITDKQFTGNLE
jgi:hypothetical protein